MIFQKSFNRRIIFLYLVLFYPQLLKLTLTNENPQIGSQLAKKQYIDGYSRSVLKFQKLIEKMFEMADYMSKTPKTH